MTRRIRNAFTLVELMVAIALVLILMLGVNRVFTTTTATVSAGQAISDNTRVARAAQATLADDFQHIVTGNQAPFIVLRSSRISAFRNRPDDLADGHSVKFKSADELTIDINGDGIEGDSTVPGEQISAAAYNFRSHRTDILSFFVRGLYPRQTGNPGENLISPMTASEAFVSYGHLQVWDGVGSLTSAQSFIAPGVGTINQGAATASVPFNPNNLYGSQFTLGRQLILLKAPNVTGAILDKANIAQMYWQRKAGGKASDLSPLAQGSTSNLGAQPVIQESSVDLAGTTIDQMRQLVANYIAALNNNTPGFSDWYSGFVYEFCGNPLLPRPITSQTLAQTAPVFVPGCTQFIVEYAGDYLNQNPDTGAITDTYWHSATNTSGTTDNQIDFVLVADPNGTTKHREIRWYGMPRDTNNDGVATGGSGVNPATINDVLPLRDLWQLSEAGQCAPFEKDMLGATAKLKMRANYMDTTGGGNNGMGVNETYTCAWGPSDPKPKMIRITIVVDDPSGRNPNRDGQTFEYVFTLP